MDQETKQELDATGEAIERAQKTLSKQPRFRGPEGAVFGQMIRWVKEADLTAPDYSSKSMKRDKWLRTFWLREPHWAGAVHQAILIDANRRWMLTGGRNQVYRFLEVLHDAEDGGGWRFYVKKLARSFRVTDMGAITELGRDGRNGPLRALYHTDSARCQLTGDPKTPLAYYPARARRQLWRPEDFFRVTPAPSDDEAFKGLGFCGTSFAIEMVKLLHGVLMHDQEKVGARMPEGFLLFDGVGEDQWERALKARVEKLDAKDRKYFGGLIAFFNEGVEQTSVQLIALSTLPSNFDRRTFIDQTLYAYALILGLDPAEIWTVPGGNLGRGTEMELQHRKAATKGVYDFSLAHQEALQRVLPSTLQFEYEQRDAEGELLDAEVAQAWADVAATLYEAGLSVGAPLLERDKSLSLLAEHSIIPPEWTEIEEETMATDTERSIKRMRERAMSSPHVQRAIVQFPREPIIRFYWPFYKMVTLWERAEDALARRLWPGARLRQDDEVLYNSGDVEITMQDVDRAIEAGKRRMGADFAALLVAEPVSSD